VRRSPVAVFLLADNVTFTQAALGMLGHYLFDLFPVINNRLTLKPHDIPF
jgi:hypothetical protein